MNWSSEFVQVALAITPFAAAALTAGLAALGNFVLKHTHNATLEHAIVTAQSLADTVVASCEQTTVSTLKASGTFTAQDAADVKATALSKLKTALPAAETAVLGSSGNISTLLSDFIEEAVLRLHSPATAAA